MLDEFKTAFENSYQLIFQKVPVAMMIANTRLQSDLSYGSSVQRVRYDITNVTVQDRVARTDLTVDVVSDSSESLLVNRDKATLMNFSEKEMVQAGPLNPGTVIGGQVAKKLGLYVDADVLYETTNALLNFDTGDLTTLVSNGVPFQITSTTTPQMVTMLPSKLRQANIEISNMAAVFDPFTIGMISQYLLGKNYEIAGTLFRNGYVNGEFAAADLYVSNNLTGEALLALATTPTDGDTVVIQGVTFTFKTTLGSTAGNVLIGGSADAARANLTAAINGSAGAGTTYVELSAANRNIITKLNRFTATNDNTANTMTLVGVGSGYITATETFTDATDAWTYSFVHSYYGRKGAIDVVIQKETKMGMSDEPKQPGSKNIWSTIIYGVKTFYDGSQQFLDVWIRR